MENSRIPKKPKSYGLVVERIVKGKKEYLICKRRDSYYYGDIIRGRWGGEDDLKKILERVEPEELERLKNNNFENLWKDFWVAGNPHVLLEEYAEAQKKFCVAQTLLEKIVTLPERESLWGFPKGRPSSYQEDNIVTAIREFCEETRLESKYITLKGEKYQKEDYCGTDGKNYQTTYFSAIYFGPNVEIKPIHFPNRIREYSHSEEIQEIKWVSKSDLPKYLNYKKILVIEGFETRSVFHPKDRTLPKNSRRGRYFVKNFDYSNRNS